MNWQTNQDKKHKRPAIKQHQELLENPRYKQRIRKFKKYRTDEANITEAETDLDNYLKHDGE